MRGPAALAPDLVHHGLLRREEQVRRRLAVLADESVHVERNPRLVAVARLLGRAAVEVGQAAELPRPPPDHRKRQRQAKRTGPHRALRGAAHGDPHRQVAGYGARIDAQPADTRRVGGARPVQPLGLVDGQEHAQLFLEELVVIVQLIAKERKTLDKTAAAHHQLGPAARQVVEGRKLLVDADRVVRAQHRHGRAELDILRGPRGSGQGRGGRRDRVIGPVMFAQPEDIQPDLVGQLDLFHEVVEPLLPADMLARHRVLADIAKGVQSDFHWISPCLARI